MSCSWVVVECECWIDQGRSGRCSGEGVGSVCSKLGLRVEHQFEILERYVTYNKMDLRMGNFN